VFISLKSFLVYVSDRIRVKVNRSQELIDLQGLSAADFIQRGQNRTIDITDSRPRNPSYYMLFEGREDVMCSLLTHAIDVATETHVSVSRSPIAFLHASPGVGKTRLFQELATLTTEHRCELVKCEINEARSVERHLALSNLLPIHISFSGRSAASEDVAILDNLPANATSGSLKFHCLLRVIFTWLVDVPVDSYDFFIQEISNELSKGPYSNHAERLFTADNVFGEIIARSDGRQPFLLVDEPMLFEHMLRDRLSAKGSCTALATEINNIMGWQDERERSKRVPIAFASRNVGLLAQSTIGRPIDAISLKLLPFDTGKHILECCLSMSMPGIHRWSYLEQLSQTMMKDPNDIVDALALLAGGHTRSLEFIVYAAKSCLGRDRSSTLGFIIDIAKTEYARCYSFGYTIGLNEAVLMALFNRPVFLDKVFVVGGIDITVGDIISCGLLIGMSDDFSVRQTAVRNANLPLLSLLAWSSWTIQNELGSRDFVVSASKEILHIANCARDRPCGEAFELIFAHHAILMRIVYKKIVEVGSSLPFGETAAVDWRHASINDMFPHHWGEMKLSKSAREARFDLTQPLSLKKLLKGDMTVQHLLADINSLTDEQFDELTSAIFIPDYSNAPGLDHFIVLKDVDAFHDKKRRVVVVAVENKYSKRTSDTQVSIRSDVTAKIVNARKLLCIDSDLEGKGDVSFLFVLSAWRGIKSTVEPLEENCVVMSKGELTKVFGKTIVDFILFADGTQPGKTAVAEKS
jgi:hypothetical protein